jgi:hypothetical protein
MSQPDPEKDAVSEAPQEDRREGDDDVAPADSGAPEIKKAGQSHDPEAAAEIQLPHRWIYRQTKIGPIKLPYYASPPVQLVLVAFVCFLCPGMFNALSGLGGGGQVNATVQNRAGNALYSTFSIVGFFAGSIVNRLGIKTTLSFGGFGYALYAASFLCYNHTENAGFVIFAGALLGVCAGLLWAAQGAIMTSYPGEGDKGKYISWFWMIFNLGAVIGSLVGTLTLEEQKWQLNRG